MLALLGPVSEDNEAASGFEERLRDAVAREHGSRGEAVLEVDHKLAVQAEERAPPMLRNRPIGPTPLEREEHCRTHEPYRFLTPFSHRWPRSRRPAMR